MSMCAAVMCIIGVNHHNDAFSALVTYERKRFQHVSECCLCDALSADEFRGTVG